MKLYSVGVCVGDRYFELALWRDSAQAAEASARALYPGATFVFASPETLEWDYES